MSKSDIAQDTVQEKKLKKIPIGIDDYKELKENGYYGVDKTRLIEDIVNDGSKVILFTRPRRFGKTLNMSMLNEFFDINKDSKGIFEDTYIKDSEVFREINNYPTIFISFKDCKGASKEELLYRIYSELGSTLEKLICLKDYSNLNQIYKNKLDIYHTLVSTKNYSKYFELSDILKVVTQAYYEIYDKPVLLLIDEYDTPIASSYDNNSYETLHSFFSGLYGTVLKGNGYLYKGILTGIQRVAKEGIFSGLNNLEVNTTLDKKYNKYFGFTEEETEIILNYYGLDLNNSVKTMYDGYNFGGLEMYNPWSIINYCDKKELKPFWINTASNNILISLLSNESIRGDFLNFLLNNKIETYINTDMTFQSSFNTEDFFGLLLNAGYITPSDKDISSIPYDRPICLRNVNTETLFDLNNIFYKRYNLDRRYGDELIALNKLLFKDYKINDFFIRFKELLLSRFSYHHLSEDTYQVLWVFFSLCVDKNDYDVISEIELGTGRSDILFKSKNSKYKHIILELKYSKSEASLENDAKKALSQIHDKKYYSGLSGDIILLGVSHHKKLCEYVYEEITN